MYMYLFLSSIDFGGMWQRTPAAPGVDPALFKGSFNVNKTPKDTFIVMEVSIHVNLYMYMRLHCLCLYMYMFLCTLVVVETLVSHANVSIQLCTTSVATVRHLNTVLNLHIRYH